MRKLFFWIVGPLLWSSLIKFLSWQENWGLPWWPHCLVTGTIVGTIVGMLIQKVIHHQKIFPSKSNTDWTFLVIVFLIWVGLSSILSATVKGISEVTNWGLAWWPHCLVTGGILGMITLIIYICWLFYQTIVDDTYPDPDYDNPTS